MLTAGSGPILLLAGAVELVEPISVAESNVTGSNSVPKEPAVPEEPAPEPVPPPVPADAWDALAEEFAPGARGLELSLPNFQRDPSVSLTRKDAAEVDRDLNRVSIQYDYSLKSGDRRQAVQAIKLLTALPGLGLYPPAYHLAALLALKQGDGPGVLAQAARWMTGAGSRGGHYARDLAIVCLRSAADATAATALGEALSQEPAARTDDPVLRAYVRFWAGAADPLPAVPVLAAAEDAGPECLRMAIRAGLYLLRQVRPEPAEALGSLLLTDELGTAELAAVLRALEGDASARPAAPRTPGHPCSPVTGVPSTRRIRRMWRIRAAG